MEKKVARPAGLIVDAQGKPRGRWALPSLALAFSIIALVATSYLHDYQRKATRTGYASLSALRLARAEFAGGLLRALPHNAPPASLDEGRELVRKASATFALALRTARWLRAGEEEEASAIARDLDRLSAALEAPPPEPGEHEAAGYRAGLREASFSLDRRIEALGDRLEIELAERLRRLFVAYLAAFSAVLLVLAYLCLAVRARARSDAEREAALKESHEVLRRIIDHAPSLVYGFDAEGRCVLANQGLASLMGRTPEEMIGQTREQWMPHEPGGAHRANDLRVFESGETISLEETFPLDGTLRYYLTTKYPLAGSGGAIDIVGGISTDITAQKQTEERLRAALAEREVLLRELNHRVKNNLQVISSWLTIQANRAKGPEAKSTLGEAEARVHAMALVHRKLYEGGDLSRVDLGSYLRELVIHLSSAHGLSSSQVSTRLGLGLVLTPVDVALPCGLIVNELFSNSLKHAFPGGRRGEIALHLRRSESGEIELDYSDDGIGCPGLTLSADAEGLGLKTVDAIGRGQLGGRTSYTTSEGFAFSLSFSDAGYEPRI